MIKMENVRKGFGRRCVIWHASGEFAGGMHLVKGDNGAGKTTLLMMLCGLIRPTVGVICADGLNVATEQRHLVGRMAFAPAQPRFFDGLKVEEALKLFYALRGRALRQKDVFALDPFKLCSQAKVRFGDLSLGWKKKIVLHMVFGAEPDFLFLDEPTLGLDAVSIRAVAELLERRGHERTTIFTCHEPARLSLLHVRGVTLSIRPGGSVLMADQTPSIELRSASETSLP